MENNHIIQIDDHPRAMVLPFDKAALESAHPRKYTSGFEIYKIPMALARQLYGENWLDKLNALAPLNLMDRSFSTITEADVLDKIFSFANSRLGDPRLGKDLRPFYKHMAYFARYAKENGTGIIFDL